MKAFFVKNNIPNILTILRILFIPFILTFLATNFGPIIIKFTIFINNKNWILDTNISLGWLLAGILFLFASITDFLDGYLSRKYKWISDFGKIWDPIADKILINSIFITLAVFNVVIWYLVIVMIVRDLIVDGYRTFLSSKKIIVPANIFGKLKTVLQIVAIIVVLFIFNDHINIESYSYYLLQNIIFIFATLSSVMSGIFYVLMANVYLKTLNNNNYFFDFFKKKSDKNTKIYGSTQFSEARSATYLSTYAAHYRPAQLPDEW